MASLKFHKVTTLPTSCTLGDVYYVAGKGIYVCTKTASSGASEAGNYQRFSYSNAASTSAKGVTKLSDDVNSSSSTEAATSKAVKTAYDKAVDGVNAAADAKSTAEGKWAQVTATQTSGGTAVEGTVKGLYANTSATGYAKSPIIEGVVWYRDTHNSHGHTFNANTPTSTAETETSVDVVSALNSADSTTGSLSSTYDRVSVPTLKVTNKLASDIADLKSINATGMQYKGTRTTGTVPADGKVGDVYKVTTKAIEGIGAEVGDFIVCNTATSTATNSAWDVWQANVNKDAYWDQNTPAGGKFIVADGTNGKISSSIYDSNSFDAAGAAATVKNEVLGTSSDDSSKATVYGAIAYITNVQTNLTGHINNKQNPHDVTASQVGLGKVTNDKQVKGLASGTTVDHFVTWGADGYTVKDSGYTASSFDAKDTAKGLVDTLRGGSEGTLKGAYDAASAAQSTAEGKWSKAYAQALAAGDGSKAGVATFNSGNFAVSDIGHVDLVWATFA